VLIFVQLARQIAHYITQGLTSWFTLWWWWWWWWWW